MKTLVESHKKKLDELDYIIHKAQKKFSTIDDISKRILEQDNRINKNESKFQMEMGMTNAQVALLRETIGIAHDEARTYKDLCAKIQADNKETQNLVIDTKKKYEKDVVRLANKMGIAASVSDRKSDTVDKILAQVS